MNDPGLDGPINDHAENVEQKHEEQNEEEEVEEQDYLDPR